jgi:hypothetical protein
MRTPLRPTLPLLLLGGAQVLGSFSCKWDQFDTLRDEAPAQVLLAPSNLPAGEFGQATVQIVPPPTGTSAELVVLANGQPGFATFTFDSHGGTSASAQAGQNITNLGDHTATYRDIAPVSMGRVLVSVEAPQSLVVVDPQTFNSPKSLAIAVTGANPQNHFGGSLAVGDVDGNGIDEWAATSDESLTVYYDEAATTTPSLCSLPTTSDASSLVHGMAAGDVDGLPGDELLVGVPGDTGGASVWILHATDLPNGATGCSGALTKLVAPDGATDLSFGEAVALGHVSSASALDLMVGAPGENKVFVFFNHAGVFGPTADETLMPGDAVNAKAFGASVESIALPAGADAGVVGDVVVGDPSASINGVVDAGRAHVFSGTTEAAVLWDRYPVTGGQVGLSLNQLDFLPAAGGARQPVLVVGAHAAVYVYFQVGLPTEKDPRN